ncbi:hypothetical protein TNCV_4135321 [Trichonephila clavipes]|nr:hypothetical protein TNCV_4135321 [Trichonephila clavipes]
MQALPGLKSDNDKPSNRKSSYELRGKGRETREPDHPPGQSSQIALSSVMTGVHLAMRRNEFRGTRSDTSVK